MMRAEQMRKLGIVGPKSSLKKTIDALYYLKAYHIRDHTQDGTFDIGSPMENAGSLSEILVRVRSLLSHLNLEGKETEDEEKSTIHQIDVRSKKAAHDVTILVEEKRAIESQLSSLSGKRNKLSQLKTSAPIQAFLSLKSVKGYAGTLPSEKEEVVRTLIGDRAILFESAPCENGSFMAFFVRAAHAQDVDALLSKHGFSPLDLKELEGLEGTPQEIEAKFSSEIAKLEKKRARIEKDLLKQGKEHGDFLLLAEAHLREELLKAEAPLRFGNTKELFFVSGWVPAAKVDEAIKAITKATQNKIHIEVSSPSHEDDVPVKLKNPVPVDSFEALIRLFSWPKYNEIDPTALMAFTLPIFFGMMLGDIGYGVIALFMFLILRQKIPVARPFFNVLIIGSISTIFFGFLFGELFGMEQIGEHHLWHVLSRAHDISTLMIITLLIGVVHVNLGYALGAYNEWKHHGFMMALTHKLSWVLVEVAAVLWYVAVAMFPGVAMWKVFAGLMSTVALYLVYKGEGFIGIIEIPSLISHIVSYVRIMAVGLASVFLALLVNQFVGILFAKGMVWFILLGIPLIILGHGFNFALGILSPFLHAVRLHYVEFFTKFYAGGGKEFTPFGEKAKKQAL